MINLDKPWHCNFVWNAMVLIFWISGITMSSNVCTKLQLFSSRFDRFMPTPPPPSPLFHKLPHDNKYHWWLSSHWLQSEVLFFVTCSQSPSKRDQIKIRGLTQLYSRPVWSGQVGEEESVFSNDISVTSTLYKLWLNNDFGWCKPVVNMAPDKVQSTLGPGLPPLHRGKTESWPMMSCTNNVSREGIIQTNHQ